MKLALLVPAVLLMAAWNLSAEVEVRLAGGKVSLRATSAPLAEILDRLSKQTGMKIVYDGAPPRQPVTASFEGRTPAEAVLVVLEGMGLNFALKMDPTGTRVETLLMAGLVPVNRAAAPAAARPAVVPVHEPEEPEEEPSEEPEPEHEVRPGSPAPAEEAAKEETQAPAGGIAPAQPIYPASPFNPAPNFSPFPAPFPQPTPSPTPPPESPTRPQ